MIALPILAGLCLVVACAASWRFWNVVTFDNVYVFVVDGDNERAVREHRAAVLFHVLPLPREPAPLSSIERWQVIQNPGGAQ